MMRYTVETCLPIRAASSSGVSEDVEKYSLNFIRYIISYLEISVKRLLSYLAMALFA